MAGRTYLPVPNWMLYALIAVAAAVAAIALARSIRPLADAVRGRVAAVQGTSPRAAVRVPGSLFYSVAGEDASAIRAATAPKGKLRTLTISSGDGAYAAVAASPNGREVAYLHAACPRCAAAYEVRDLASGAVHVVGTSPLRLPLAGNPRDFAWSEDGRLAFVEQDLDAPQPRVFLSDERTGERRPVAPDDAQLQAEPVWSPDGSKLAYLAGDGTVVSVVDVKTGAVRRLNDQLPGASTLSWSPDGHYLSVLQGGSLWLIEASNGHGFSVQTPGADLAFAGWSPASDAVLVVAGQHDGLTTSRGVYTVPVSSSAPRLLGSGSAILSARWSADGRTIAWSAADGHGWGIWTVGATGGTPTLLAKGSGTAVIDDWR